MSEGAARVPPTSKALQPTPANPRVCAAVVVLAVGAVLFAITALVLNGGLQFVWLSRRWLYKSPHGFAWLILWCVVALAALIAITLAARAGRIRSLPWPALRWIPPAALAAWIWAWYVPPPPVLFDLELAFSGCAALWCVGLAAWAWRRAPHWPRSLWWAEMLLLEVALCVFSAEFALRSVRALSNLALLATAGTDTDAWLRAHRQLPGSFHLGFPVNSAGLVDVEPGAIDPRTPLIACLGDSFGVGIVPHHLHYTTLAEQALGAEIYNVGVVNAGPREYLRLLETDVLPLKPRLIVVTLFVGNDITDARRHSAGFVESWLDRDEILIRVVPRRLFALGEIPAREALTFEVTTGRAFDAAESSRLMPWLADPLLEVPSLSRERFLFVEHVRTEILLPAWSKNYADFFRLMEQLLEEASPLPVACLIFPDEFQVDDALWNALLVDGVSPQADRELPQRQILAWLAERAVPCIDVLPRLRAAAPLSDGASHVFHRGDTHFNARGNAIAAQALADLARQCGIGR